MGKNINRFIKGRMDSDTHNTLIDNESYRYAENLRIIGDGNDGAFKNLKGSEMVADFSENGTMTVLGMYEGDDNKIFYFLGMPNGKSKIVEYDVEKKTARLIIGDNSVLRFDLVRWNQGVEIRPLQYVLNINQVGELLIFSNEKWKNIYSVNINRIQDYAGGFTEEDIMLAKKPPVDAPLIFSTADNPAIQDKNKKDKFVSFSYRYKYKDGDYSSLSFYSEAVFNTLQIHKFKVNSERLNEGMVNAINTVELSVNSGGKDVTDVEVYAKEHGSNTLYLITSINKKTGGHGDNITLPLINYSFSNNYKILADSEANALYSNAPFHPKTQDVAGNRLFVANYKEGYDLPANNPISLQPKLVSAPLQISTNNNKTIASLFTVKTSMAYYDDFNISTTALLNEKQAENELYIPFERRFDQNSIAVKINHQPPAWATKFKFLVNVQELNYETLYITHLRKVGIKVYLHLSGDNVNRLKKDDVIIKTDILATQKFEYKVLEVKEYTPQDGVLFKGIYALIEVGSEFTYTPNSLPNVNTSYETGHHSIDNDAVNPRGSSNPLRFVSVGAVYANNDSRYWNIVRVKKSDIGLIKEGDTINLSFVFNYQTYDLGGSDAGFQDQYEVLNFSKQMYASRDYATPMEFFVENFDIPYFNMEEDATNIYFRTNNSYPDYVSANAPSAYNFADTFSGDRHKMCVVPKSTLTIIRGIKPVIFRTENKEVLNEYYYETPKTFKIQNNTHIGADSLGFFDIGFHNAYNWGNGVESYKIKDGFNAKKLNYNFRPTLFESKGYKRVHRKYDITYGGIYNYELGMNYLSMFNPIEVNWKTLPIKYGEIQRIISTDGNITAFLVNKVVNVYYGKSIIMDVTGNESVGLSKEVLGDYKVLPYEYGISNNPESIAISGNILFFVDTNRSRFLIKSGEEIQEINAPSSGFHKEGSDLLKNNSSFLGCYDDRHGEYIVCLNGEKNIAFSLQNKGFTTYYNWKSDFNFSMNGKYFTAYKGKIYENEVTEDYGNIAGQEVRTSKFKFVVNVEPNQDKVFQTMFLQSNTAWQTEIKTNLTATTIPESAYQKNESFFFTHIYRDTATTDAMVGIGTIQKITGNTLYFKNAISNLIAVGDTILNESSIAVPITNMSGNTIQISDGAIYNIGQFIMSKKQQTDSFRPNGVPMRGETMEVTLSKTGNKSYNISSVTTEIKSSP